MTVPEVPDRTSSVRHERTIEVQGIATHLFEAGPETAAPLLYLHGTFLGNLWLDYHIALSRQFHTFVPDTPGFGLTERPNWMRDMSDYILYFRDLLDVLNLKTVNLVGHSLGGWMAAELAVWYPERIEKLVLSNAIGIRVKGSPVGDLFAMNPQEIVATCFENPLAALPLAPAEANIDYFVRQYNEATTLASLAWNPGYDPKLARRLQRPPASPMPMGVPMGNQYQHPSSQPSFPNGQAAYNEAAGNYGFDPQQGGGPPGIQSARTVPMQKARVLVELEGKIVSERPLNKRLLTVGRLSSNDVQVPNQRVSRLHAKISQEGGVWIIEDAESVNGLVYQGSRIDRHVLNDGDRIYIAPKAVLHFQAVK